MLSNMLRWLDNQADDVERFLSKHDFLLLIGFSVVYFVSTIAAAKDKPFWFDEFFTLGITKLPAAEVLPALREGRDLTPPLFHVVTRASAHAFGSGRVGLRMPGMLGCWTACLCVFAFVYRRMGSIPAYTALIFPLLTAFEAYTREARGYGLMFGFCAMALLAWQTSACTGERRRALAIAGLFAAAFCAVASHSYGIFFIVPLGIGELVRYKQTKTLDLPVCLALSGFVLPVVLFAALVRTGAATNSKSLHASSLRSIPDFYTQVFAPAIPVLVLVCVAAALYVLASRVSPDSGQARPPVSRMLDHEIASAVGLACLPVLVILSTIPHHVYFHFRYALVAVFGFAILAAAIMTVVRRTCPGIGVVCLICMGLALAKVELPRWRHLFAGAAERAAPFPSLTESKLPIYVQDGVLYLDWAHSMPAEILTRLRFVSEPALELFYTGDSPTDILVGRLKPLGRRSIETYDELKAGPSQFLLCRIPQNDGWLDRKLLADGMKLDLLDVHGEVLVFLVSRAQAQVPSGQGS